MLSDFIISISCLQVVWGHEHECLIEPAESVVGTFRITQPGSSVATSLTTGEAVRKHVGILDVKYNQFRLRSIPLTQVRSFVMGDISLAQHDDLDADDPKIDAKVSKVLEEEVKVLIHDAKEKHEELLEAAKAMGNYANEEPSVKYKLEKPEEVLVRLKVEHTGFTTLNNQRFGAKFVGKVANPVRQRRVGTFVHYHIHHSHRSIVNFPPGRCVVVSSSQGDG
jgi:double-strand break repair protein MRE11